MKNEVEVAIVFSRKYIKGKNITILVPQKAIIGRCVQDSKFFIDNKENKKFKNMDEVNYQHQKIGFYYAKSLKELEKIYETKDLNLILTKYMDEICSKVHYYEPFDENNFESYLLKNESVENFNKKYKVKPKYNNNSKNIYKKDYNSKDDVVGSNILILKKYLKENVFFQDRATDKIIKTIYSNLILDNDRNNIFISGPSGVGKTKTLEIIKSTLEYPMVYTSIKDINQDYSASYILSQILSKLCTTANYKERINDHAFVIIDDLEKLGPDNMFEFQNELLDFFQTGLISMKKNQNVLFNPKKMTFILCGNFNKIDKQINVPANFFKYNTKIDSKDLILDHNTLINFYMFSKEMLDYFQTEVLYEELDLEKSKKIISSLNNKFLQLYLKQLEEQGLRKLIIEKSVIDLLAKHIYSKSGNLKDLDKTIKKMFEEVMYDSINFIGKQSELTITKEILDNDKKGYQFTLKK